MRRRPLLASIAALAVPQVAKASGGVLGMTPAGPLMRVFISQPQIIQQQCPMWCWAASCSMIFAANGFALDQTQIVSAVFGGTVCSGGLPGVIGTVLSSNWIDNITGRPFFSKVSAAYDSFDGVYNINNAIIVNELANNRPLLYANQHHAMVIVQADFLGPPQNPDVQAVYVLDPWPWSPSFHQLSPPEMIPDNAGGQMTFLASVSVW